VAQCLERQWRSHSDHPIDPADLVTAQEIADRLGFGDPRRVRDWSLLGHFPAAVARGRNRYWYWPEVDLWAAERHPGLRSRPELCEEIR